MKRRGLLLRILKMAVVVIVLAIYGYIIDVTSDTWGSPENERRAFRIGF